MPYLLEKSPDGLDTTIGEMGVKLSGGEKQRLSIARALIRRPRPMIFDEATSTFDSITEEQISETMRAISGRGEQITTLICAPALHHHARRHHLRAGERMHRRKRKP